jgi:hypothetical protein
MMYVPHMKYTYGPPRPVTEIAFTLDAYISSRPYNNGNNLGKIYSLEASSVRSVTIKIGTPHDVKCTFLQSPRHMITASHFRDYGLKCDLELKCQ